MKTTITIILLALFAIQGFSQQEKDSLKVVKIKEVTITGSRSTVERLPAVQGPYIWAGKKNEVIQMQFSDANIAERSPRQIFAKVPGLFVYDMDGAGNQVNISTRGLDPHRGWEFNIRENGVITNTDMYGYPASHFSIPMEAIERIELVRGTGALQYGSQFGGMLNYVMKRPDTTRTMGLESVNSVGSFGMLSTFNALGGKVGKLEYFAYFNRRGSNGYRDNCRSDFGGEAVSLTYRPGKRLSLIAEFAHSKYVVQLPGQLTDSMFLENPRQSTRSRNYYSPDIYVPSLRAAWALGENSNLSCTVSAVLGSRSSVMFDKPATTVDAIDPLTLEYAPRQVDIDQYHSYTTELRFLHRYTLLKGRSALAAGVQYTNNDLHRRQQGVGTTGTDYDLTAAGDKWGRNMHFKTQNLALFAENLFQLTPRFSVSPGIRMEMGESRMTGVISYLPDDEIPNSIEHRFPLMGVNVEYKPGERQSLYAGWSQAFRPVIFKDIVPGSVYEKADKDLKDARGYNLEAGYRGQAGGLRWDVSLFRLQYNNRLGNQAIPADSNFIIFRTNIGNSTTQGVEFFAEYGLGLAPSLRLQLFTSTSFMDAVYEDAHIRVGNENIDISGNSVESVPQWISRSGLTLRYKTVSLSTLYSYTGETYADPLNTEKPSATGSVGLVPAYGLLDLNATWRVIPGVVLRLSLNNATDVHYFTKRPSFYPGPGIWPSDGRSMVVSLGVKI